MPPKLACRQHQWPLTRNTSTQQHLLPRSIASCTKRQLLLSSMTLTAAADDISSSAAVRPLGGAAAAAAVGASSQPVGAIATTPATTSQLPTQSSKTIYLIRHGEGWHNIGYDHNLDPHLTPRGWQQTAALQQHLSALQQRLSLQLVVMSPLRRTLETAAGVFGAAAAPVLGNKLCQTAEAATATAAARLPAHSISNWLLMQPQAAKPEQVTQASTRYLPVSLAVGSSAGGVLRPLHLLAHEGCRERIGPHVCDKFRDIPLQVADFPGVDFSLIKHDRDVEWERVSQAVCQDGGCYLIGEEESATEARALAFYRWLMARPESHIAVVSHCGFLVHGMRALGRSMLKTWNAAMLEAACSAAAQQQQQQPAEALQTSSTGAGNGTGTCSGFDGAAAEALRVAAGDVGGRMSTDWMNCEMRSITLQWGPASAWLSSDNTAAGHNQDQGQWLWATPGDASTWFPGGLYGL